MLRSKHGPAVRLLPLALATILEEQGGVFDFLLVQVAPDALTLAVGGEAPAAARARAALVAFLQVQGLPEVRVDVAHRHRRARGRSGKLQRVVALQRGATGRQSDGPTSVAQPP